MNVITDIEILVLPLPIILRLQISKAQKLQLIGIFSLGGFVCIASIVRAPQVLDIGFTDGSWSNVPSAVWSAVELNTGIVSACLPTLRPIFKLVRQGHRQVMTQIKGSTSTNNRSRIKFREFSKSSKGAGYGDLETAADVHGLINLNQAGQQRGRWEIHAPQKVSVRGTSLRRSESGRSRADNSLEPNLNEIMVTTEVEVCNFADMRGT
ncbi:hypothetical protein ACLMJK_007985 [Lecanora helva]